MWKSLTVLEKQNLRKEASNARDEVIPLEVSHQEKPQGDPVGNDDKIFEDIL